MKKLGIVCAVCVALCSSVWAVEPLVLFDFEGSDMASMRGIEVSSEQSKTGRAAGKWANHPATPTLTSSDIPHDWSDYDTLSFWMYSAAANDAAFMMVLSSENPESEGIDYYSTKITVNWTGWKFFEFPFAAIGKSRQPVGFNKIDSMRFTATGWNNQPQEDTVIYLDDVRLIYFGAQLRNASFDVDSTGEGVPDSWTFSPRTQDNPDASLSIVEEGRTGKAVKIVDNIKDVGVGISQRVPVTPGKNYKLSAWKKGDMAEYTSSASQKVRRSFWKPKGVRVRL